MQRREKILLSLLVGALIVWRGFGLVRGVFLGTLDERKAKVETLKKSQEITDENERKLLVTMKKMGDWKERSLPPDPLEALRLYQQWLTDLGQTSGLSNLHVAPEARQGSGPGYRVISASVKGEGTFEQLTSFLHEFQRIALLHRIANLKVEAPKIVGQPLKVTITAEGLCLDAATPRTRMLARTILVDSLPRSFDTVKVASTEGFPKEPGFNARIEKEFVKVTKIDGNTWTVKRALEGTTAARHAPKAEVEYCPIRDERKEITLDDRKKALAAHPFLKPGPPPTRVIDPNDPAVQTRLTSSSIVDEEQSAMLYNPVTQSRTVVRKGTAISIGDIQGTVVSIDPKYVQIKRGNDLWQLNLGKNLRSMVRTEDLSAPQDNLFMDAFGDQPFGAPTGAARPGGGDAGSTMPAASSGQDGRGPRSRDGRGGGGGFRSRRGRGADSAPDMQD